MYGRLMGLMLVLAVLVAGCGSSGSNSSSSAQAAGLSKEELVKQGNAICKKAIAAGNVAAGAVLKKVSKSNIPTSKAGEMASEAALPALQNLVAELVKLEPPEEDQAEVDAFIKEYEAGLKEVEAEPKLLISGSPFQKADEAAKSYGLTSCTA